MNRDCTIHVQQSVFLSDIVIRLFLYLFELEIRFKFQVRFHYTNGKLAIGDSKPKLLMMHVRNYYVLKNRNILEGRLFCFKRRLQSPLSRVTCVIGCGFSSFIFFGFFAQVISTTTWKIHLKGRYDCSSMQRRQLLWLLIKTVSQSLPKAHDKKKSQTK